MPKAATQTTEIVPTAKPTAPVAVAKPQTSGEAVALFAQLAQQNVDVDKLERLMSLYERMIEKHAVEEFAIAMQAAQSEMRAISADATNPQTHSRYASYAKLDGALRPIYTAHGFAVSYDTAKSDKPEHLLVLAYVSHRSGHVRTYQVEMPNDGKGAKGGDVMTKTHATGAAMTYGMRYLLKMIYNVAVGEDDTDGNPPRAHASAQPARRPAKRVNDDGSVQVMNVRMITGTIGKGARKGQSYTLGYIKFSDGKEIGTFDTKIADLAAKAHASGARVTYSTKTTKTGKIELDHFEVQPDDSVGFGAELPTEREPGDERDEDVLNDALAADKPYA